LNHDLWRNAGEEVAIRCRKTIDASHEKLYWRPAGSIQLPSLAAWRVKFPPDFRFIGARFPSDQAQVLARMMLSVVLLAALIRC